MKCESHGDVEGGKVVGFLPKCQHGMKAAVERLWQGRAQGRGMRRCSGTEFEGSVLENKLDLDKGLPRSLESQGHTFAGEPSFLLCNFLFPKALD